MLRRAAGAVGAAEEAGRTAAPAAQHPERSGPAHAYRRPRAHAEARAAAETRTAHDQGLKTTTRPQPRAPCASLASHGALQAAFLSTSPSSSGPRCHACPLVLQARANHARHAAASPHPVARHHGRLLLGRPVCSAPVRGKRSGVKERHPAFFFCNAPPARGPVPGGSLGQKRQQASPGAPPHPSDEARPDLAPIRRARRRARTRTSARRSRRSARRAARVRSLRARTVRRRWLKGGTWARVRGGDRAHAPPAPGAAVARASWPCSGGLPT